jgi:deoxyadenosine/deoxycytidine kinase
MVLRMVEIVGPAGAGKTTLCHALNRNSESIHLSDFPDVRKISAAPFFIRNGIQIQSFLFNLHDHKGRKLLRREFAWLSILYGWPAVLQKELANHNVIILDQGPIYLLTEIKEFGPEYLRKQESEKFWHDLYSRWTDMLDMIVWLDAPDAILLKRIRGRNKGHVVKNESVEATFEFFASYRKAYERTISNLQSDNSNLQILRFDTSHRSPEEIASQLLYEFGSA